MTTVVYDAENCIIDMHGHAGAGEYGHDIVCAGLSALWYALKTTASAQRESLLPIILEAPGDVRMTFRPTADGRIIMDTIANGLEALSIEYPEHVKFRKIGG